MHAARLSRNALISTLVALALALPSPAFAGGSWIEGQRAYGVGQPATFSGSFSMHGSLEGTLADGPYVAYLAPVEISSVDHPLAIRVGEIQITRSEGATASVAFTVPDVHTGKYHLIYCNEPCTVDGIGDLIGGEAFYIAPSYQEAALLARVERLEWRLAEARRNTRQERRKSDSLQQRLDARERDLANSTATVATLETELAEASASAAREMATERSLAPGWALIVAAALLTVGVVAAGAIIRRRRTPNFIVPDTIPDEFETRESALRS
jgi:hypothetical protein